MRVEKYRPCLTGDQISHILALCKKDLSQQSLLVISVLAPFQAKIDFSGVAPAYSANARRSLEDSLGMNNTGDSSTPIERRKIAYEKWCQNPDSCSMDELERANTYRRDNNLMTPEEEAQFDAETEAHYLKQ